MNRCLYMLAAALYGCASPECSTPNERTAHEIASQCLNNSTCVPKNIENGINIFHVTSRETLVECVKKYYT